MKKLELTDEEFEMVISGISNEISTLEKLLRRRIGNSLRVHIEGRLPRVRTLLNKLKSEK